MGYLDRDDKIEGKKDRPAFSRAEPLINRIIEDLEKKNISLTIEERELLENIIEKCRPALSISNFNLSLTGDLNFYNHFISFLMMFISAMPLVKALNKTRGRPMSKRQEEKMY